MGSVLGSGRLDMTSSLAGVEVPGLEFRGGRGQGWKWTWTVVKTLGWLGGYLWTRGGAGNTERAWVMMGWGSPRSLGVGWGRQALTQAEVWGEPFLPGDPRAQ